MSLQENLQEMEQTRERYWLRYPSTSPTKLRWRALTIRHCFHVLPGEKILELGAGSGVWIQHSFPKWITIVVDSKLMGST